VDIALTILIEHECIRLVFRSIQTSMKRGSLQTPSSRLASLSGLSLDADARSEIGRRRGVTRHGSEDVTSGKSRVANVVNTTTTTFGVQANV
jgi:hypothetical protein